MKLFLTVWMLLAIILGGICMGTGIKHTTTADGTIINDPTVWSEQHTYDAASATATEPFKFVWKDASETALTLSNQAATVSWTDLDLTSYTSANAKAALLLLIVSPDVAAKRYYLAVRKDNTSPAFYPSTWVTASMSEADFGYKAEVIVGVSTTQVIEYYAYVEAGGQADFYVIVVGYME